MAYSTRTIGIIIASILAVIFIGIAFLVSGPLPFHLLTANAQSTHDLLVSYAAKDTDGDGLPDWEEVLYGTDPNNAHSVSPSLTDSEAVAQGLVKPKFASATTTPVDAASIPGVAPDASTLTDQFARNLFSEYLSKRGATPPTADDVATFVQSGVSTLAASQAIPDAFNAGQVHVVGSGADALGIYAAGAETDFSRHAVSVDKSEVEYLSDAVTKNDSSALTKVGQLGKMYSAVAQDYIATPVPKEAAAAHLEVANALAHLGSTITDLSVYNSDPLRTMLALAEYPKDVTNFARALTDLYTVYNAENVFIGTGTPGSHFYSTLVLAASPATPSP